MYRTTRKQIAALLILIAGLFAFAGCSSSPDATPRTTPAAEAPKSAEPVKEQPLTGVWKDDIFEAEIKNGIIVINIVADDTKSLYWQGTFPAGSDEVTSIGDREVLDASLLASQDDEKVFNLADGKISFDFTMMGTTKTVHMKKV